LARYSSFFFVFFCFPDLLFLCPFASLLSYLVLFSLFPCLLVIFVFGFSVDAASTNFVAAEP
jgi:hypothetical protein